MNPAYYAGEMTTDGPRLWFFDGYCLHDLAERCRLQGLTVERIPDWTADGPERYTLARMILTDAGGGTEYVNDMDRHFALTLTFRYNCQAWKMPLEVVHAWMVLHEPLRRQLRTLFGRNCPSCG